MTTIDITDVPTAKVDDIKRDRWGRPLILPPNGGKAVGYTRVTTLAKTLDDNQGLINWKATATVVGALRRPGLHARWQTLMAEHGGDPWYAATEGKAACKALVEECAEAGGSADRAEIGTALHRMTELLDAGATLGPITDEVRADLAAYRAAMDAYGVTILPDAIEVFVVLDDLQVAGTFDRLVRMPDGRVLVADLKTGADLAWSWQSIAVQLSCYAHGLRYRVADGTRSPLPEGLDVTTGLVIHLPAGEARCELHELDLVAGWEAAQLSMEVRKWRTRKNLARPVTGSVSASTAAIVTTSSRQESSATDDSSSATPTPAETLSPAGVGVVESAGRCAASTATTPPTSSPVSDGAASTAATTSPPAEPDKRTWLLQRLEVVKANPAAEQLLGAQWRASLLPPMGKATTEHFAEIERLLDDVERAYKLPFNPEPQPPTPEPAPAARVVPAERDEGPDMEPADIDALRRARDELTAEGRAFVDAMACACRDAGVSVSLARRPSRWRFVIARTLMAWATVADEELFRAGLALVLGDDAVQPAFSTGALIGSLGEDDATCLELVARAIDEGSTVADYSTGVCRLQRAA